MGTNAIYRNLERIDPFIHEALKGEKHRQQNQIEMIASENTVSHAVLEALGSEITNKTVEGYPGHRFHGGAKYADIVEQAAIDRAMELFGCDCQCTTPLGITGKSSRTIRAFAAW